MAPTLALNGKILIFQSDRKGSEGYMDLYESVWENGKWSIPRNLRILNTRFFEGYPRITADGKTLYFSSNRHTGDARSYDLDIYYSKRVANKWGKPVKLDHINSNQFDGLVSFSADKKTMYFSSNRPGGIGKMDIYKVSLDKKKQFKSPVVLPAPINTKYDEINPYMLMTNDRLFLASNRPGGKGGYDLYYCERSTDGISFKPAKSLGDWINTDKNEFLYAISENLPYMLVTEDKDPDHNIYQVTLPKHLLPDSVTTVKGKIKVDQKNEPLKNYPILFTIRNPQMIKHSGYIPPRHMIVHSSPDNGSYTAFLIRGQKYIMQIDKTGYRPFRHFFDLTKPSQKTHFDLDITLESRPIEDDQGLVRFDSGKAELSNRGSITLDNYAEYMLATPDVKVSLYGNIDIIENEDKKNRGLGFKRCQVVREYLLKKGINKQRIRIAGQGVRGDKKPQISDEELAENRVVEFKFHRKKDWHH